MEMSAQSGIFEKEPHNNMKNLTEPELGLAVRKAGLPVRLNDPGKASINMAVPEKGPVLDIEQTGNLLRFIISVKPLRKGAKLHPSALRNAVAQLIDSIIVMLPLGITAAVLHLSGALNPSSAFRNATLLSSAAFSGSIALFLAWGVSYFMISEKIFGTTPGRAITGVRGVGATSWIFIFGRALLSYIKHIFGQSNFKVPSLAIALKKKWLREIYLLPKSTLIQHEPIPLPQSIIDI